MNGLILIVGDASHSKALVELLASNIDIPVLVVVDQPKKEESFNLVPQKIDFALDEKRHYVKFNKNNYREVQKRNAFFNKRHK